jgi:hypothetical protein
MTAKAGDSFRCVVCRDPYPLDEAAVDPQCGGPACEDCRRLMIKAVAYLKHEGIDRPLQESDINNFNCNRIKNFYP